MGPENNESLSTNTATENKTRRRRWTAEEDQKLKDCIARPGARNWDDVARMAGLSRSGKSCRLRYFQHLHPQLRKHGLSPEEEKLVIGLHAISLGKRKGNNWAEIAEGFPGVTDNDIKNFVEGRKRRCKNTGEPLHPPEVVEQVQALLQGHPQRPPQDHPTMSHLAHTLKSNRCESSQTSKSELSYIQQRFYLNTGKKPSREVASDEKGKGKQLSHDGNQMNSVEANDPFASPVSSTLDLGFDILIPNLGTLPDNFFEPSTTSVATTAPAAGASTSSAVGANLNVKVLETSSFTTTAELDVDRMEAVYDDKGNGKPFSYEQGNQVGYMEANERSAFPVSSTLDCDSDILIPNWRTLADDSTTSVTTTAAAAGASTSSAAGPNQNMKSLSTPSLTPTTPELDADRVAAWLG